MPSCGTHSVSTDSPLRCDDLLGELREIGDEAAEFFENTFDQLEREWRQFSKTDSRQRSESSQWEQKWTSQFDAMRAMLEDLSRRLPSDEPAAPAASTAEPGAAAPNSGVRPGQREPGAFRSNRARYR
jgi:hypothetical protein